MSTFNNDISASESPQPGRPVAPLWHTAIVLLLLLATSVGGALTHHWTGPLTPHIASEHRSHIPMYAVAALWEWSLLALVLWGVRLSGAGLRQLLGVRRAGVVEIWTDFAIALGFWFTSLIVLGAVVFLLRLAHLHPENIRGVVTQNGSRIFRRAGHLDRAQHLRGHLRRADFSRLSAAAVHRAHAAHMARDIDFSGVFWTFAWV